MTTFSTIMEKLKATEWYPNFVRHLNGDTLDNRVENLEFVTLKDAFKHINSWKVDCVYYITPEEREFVVNLLTTTPEVYHYIKYRAQKEETGFALTPNFFKQCIHKGMREFFGALCNDLGVVQQDPRQPECFIEFRGL